MEQQLLFKLDRVPEKPGVYLWKDKYGQIIYVGKAKNLFSRTHQYFTGAKDYKTTELVKHIHDIDFIQVHNENESLLLEANLIKKHQPKYNILLKDGSGYPYILLTNEVNPRILYTRDFKKNKGQYWGPFATTKSNKYDVYNLLLKIIPFRKCNVVPRKKCLYYDIGQCLGPCINKISPTQYAQYIHQTGEFFKGKPQSILNQLSIKENDAAKKMEFEEAKQILELSDQLKQSSKEMAVSQTVNLKNHRDTDVIGYYLKQQYVTIVIFSYINGKLLTKFQQIAEIHDEIEETLSQFIMQYYQNSYNKPKTCYVNLMKASLKSLSKTLTLDFINPISGKYKTIIQNAASNARRFHDTNLLVYQRKRQMTTEAFNDLRKTLNLDNLSLIHVFDMSNLFGKDKVGSMIALENGAFNKSLYRKFIIKDLNATSDYAYTYEVTKRQYTKMIQGGMPLPNLIIADGGVIQINAIRKALSELHIEKIIPVIGLVKDKHHRTDAIVINSNQQISLDHKSNLYTYLYNIQEEVHRYAISFFRKRFKDSSFKSILDDIPGLGSKSVNKLLAHYDNIANIKQASIEELKQYVNEKIARAILKKD